MEPTSQNVTLVPLRPEDKDRFILDNQEAFNFGALEEFGRRDDRFEENGQIISRATIEQSIDAGDAYRIMLGEREVGGTVVNVEGDNYDDAGYDDVDGDYVDGDEDFEF